jgi:hypothetical protein
MPTLPVSLPAEIERLLSDPKIVTAKEKIIENRDDRIQKLAEDKANL